MASGSFTGSTNNKYITPKIVWSSDSSYNLAAALYLYKYSTYGYRTTGRGDWYITINGTTAHFNEYVELYSDAGWVYVGSATVNIPAANRGSVSISASGGISGTSYTTTSVSGTADIAPPVLTLTVSDITTTGCRLTAAASVSTGTWGYSLDGGNSWIGLSNPSGTSMTASISGLSSNTAYSICVRGAKTANGTYGVSNIVSAKTLGSTSIDSAGDVTADADTVVLNMTWTEYISGCTHKLELISGDTSVMTRTGLTAPLGTAPVLITLTASERAVLLQSLNAKSAAYTLRLTTYSDDILIGTSERNISVGVTDASAPEFSTSDCFTCFDSNADTVSVTGDDSQFVLNYSVLNVTVPAASAKNGAVIAKYSVAVNGVTKDYLSSGTLSFGTLAAYGDIPVAVTVTDSRGLTVSAVKNISVINYVDIKITSSSVRRTNNVDTTAEMELTGEIYPVAIDGTARNTLQSAQFRYKLTTAAAYSDWVSFAPTSTTAAFAYSTDDLGVTFDSNCAYDIQVSVSDKISSDTVQMYIPVGVPLVALRKDKVGIGKIDPEYTLDVNGTIHDASGTVPSIVEQGTSGIWTYRKWSDGTAECWGERDLGTVSITNSYGYAYYVTTSSIDFPFEFAEIPCVWVNNQAGNGLVTPQPVEVRTTYSKFYLISATSNSLKVALDIYARGTWKTT